MPTPGVSQLLYLFDEAFEGTQWHSLLGNLQAVKPEDWLWVPPDGQRSIRDIVQHVGGGKIMYDNKAFGDGKLTWDDPVIEDNDAVLTMSSAIEWLRKGHERMRHNITLLNDADLLRPRMTHMGNLKEIRWFIAVMIQHDLYHAGEINHIRALRHQDDF
jgi:hypothetical protein